MLVMLSNKHTKNSWLLCHPSNHVARGVPVKEALMRTPSSSTMIKEFPSSNGQCDPKKEDRNTFTQLVQCPQVLICPPPPRPPSNGHFTP
ncbi:hypothetical protein O181_010622 [Austropuccinia psidii MF-1]|uniref:Uncharacterized protein n=1 Tax=Austropuccinia psidii MF-1 TaxID=1389203 RepID=A0A9Q3GLD4_9BASI|nr:hypothetical protein [Austropuccinia psidii MF-1]